MSIELRNGVALLAGVVCLAAAGPVSSEGFLDLYVGGAYTEDAGGSFGGVSAPLSFDNAVAGGIRGGYWFQGAARWLGIGLDMSYFGPDALAGTNLHMIPITPMLMVRIPLFARDGFEHGQFQPYAAVGPGMFVSVLTIDVPGIDDVGAGFDVGLDVRAGVAVMLTRVVGLFVEYRRTDVDVEISSFDFAGKFKTNLTSNHVNGGLALRF